MLYLLKLSLGLDRWLEYFFLLFVTAAVIQLSVFVHLHDCEGAMYIYFYLCRAIIYLSVKVGMYLTWNVIYKTQQVVI